MTVGDLVEVPVKDGFAYLQLVLNHAPKMKGFCYGWYCRVLPGTFKQQPPQKRLQELIQEQERFGCFLADVHRLRVVGKFPVPAKAAGFPICKQASGRVTPGSVWDFWNGTERRVAYRIPRLAANLPNAEIIDSVVVQERIKANWIPSHDVPNECIDPTLTGFVFEDYPLSSDFEKEPSRYGDIYGFLESRGMVGHSDSNDTIEITGLARLIMLQPDTGWSNSM